MAAEHVAPTSRFELCWFWTSILLSVVCCGALAAQHSSDDDKFRSIHWKHSGASDAQLFAFAQVLSPVRVGEGAHPWVGGLFGLPVLTIRSTSRGALSGLV